MSDALTFIPDAVSLVGDIAGPYVLVTKAGTSIGGIIPDVSIQEVISDENAVTQHPVETGTPVADHIYANPITCDLVVAWSDSGPAGYSGRSQDLYQIILGLRDTREPFDVYTIQRMLPNMVFGSIVSRTDEATGCAVFLSVRLQQVIISDTSGTSDPSTGTNANQADPATTGTSTNMGQVALQPWNGPGLTPIGTVAGGV